MEVHFLNLKKMLCSFCFSPHFSVGFLFSMSHPSRLLPLLRHTTETTTHCLTPPSRPASSCSSDTQQRQQHTQRQHTCMMDTRIHVANRKLRSVMHGKGKARGQEQVFLNTHEPPVNTCNSLTLLVQQNGKDHVLIKQVRQSSVLD